MTQKLACKNKYSSIESEMGKVQKTEETLKSLHNLFASGLYRYRHTLAALYRLTAKLWLTQWNIQCPTFAERNDVRFPTARHSGKTYTALLVTGLIDLLMKSIAFTRISLGKDCNVLFRLSICYQWSTNRHGLHKNSSHFLGCYIFIYQQLLYFVHMHQL